MGAGTCVLGELYRTGFLSQFYLLLVLVDLGFLLTYFPKLNLWNKKEKKFLVLVSLLTGLFYLLPTPHHVYAGEFNDFQAGEIIAREQKFLFCSGFEGERCVKYDLLAKPPGFQLLVSFLVKAGISAYTSARLLNILFIFLSTLLFYFISQEILKNDKRSLIATLVFILLPQRVILQKTTTLAVSSLFFFLLFFYSFIRYRKRREKFGTVCACLSYFINIRPENFILALPFVLYLLYFQKRGENWKIFLLINLIFSALYQEASGVMDEYRRASTIPTKIHRLKTFFLPFFLAFFNPSQFNPAIPTFSLFGWRRWKIENFLLLALFLLSIVVYASFEHGSVTGTYGSRYSILPATALLLIALSTSPQFLHFLLFSSLFLFPFYPALREKNMVDMMYELLAEKKLSLENYTTVFFDQPYLIHIFYPEKNVYRVFTLQNFKGRGIFLSVPWERKTEINPPCKLRKIKSFLLTELEERNGKLVVYEVDCRSSGNENSFT